MGTALYSLPLSLSLHLLCRHAANRYPFQGPDALVLLPPVGGDTTTDYRALYSCVALPLPAADNASFGTGTSGPGPTL
uniref:Putative secreted protein n=1 Tax=Anopheles darlingi TaxID=43151 RepID=A0A2M4D532_ANODA